MNACHLNYGICNKMNTLASVIDAFIDTNSINQTSKLICYWVADKYNIAEYQHLFEPMDLPFNLDIYTIKYKRDIFYKGLHTNNDKWLRYATIEAILKKYHKLGLSDTFDAYNDVLRQKIIDCDILQFYGNIYGFKCISKTLLKFKPIKSLQSIIDSYDFDDNTVGMHIRRGDHDLVMAKPINSLDTFLAKTKQLIDENKSIFLCTDDPILKADYKKKFGNHIITHDFNEFDRNSVIAIQHGLIDLYVLAKCKTIIKSHGSSFSNTAEYLYKLNNNNV